MSPKKPNLFIVGAAKCGTTALYTYLREHPQVFMPAMKEPGFFAEDIMGSHRPIKTMQEYLNLFAPARDHKRIGEASTTYFVSTNAPTRIRTFSPDAKIIIMLRNPVEKIHARFSEGRVDGQEHHDTFEVALECERKRGPSFGIGYIESAKYLNKVKTYFETFGRENVHVLLYDDFASSPLECYEGVLRFLELPSDGRTLFPVVNPNHYVKSIALHHFMSHPPQLLRKALLASVPSALWRQVRSSLVRWNVVYSSGRQMNPDVRVRLQNEFCADVNGLSVLLGRDLTHWLR